MATTYLIFKNDFVTIFHMEVALRVAFAYETESPLVNVYDVTDTGDDIE